MIDSFRMSFVIHDQLGRFLFIKIVFVSLGLWLIKLKFELEMNGSDSIVPVWQPQHAQLL